MIAVYLPHVLHWPCFWISIPILLQPFWFGMLWTKSHTTGKLKQGQGQGSGRPHRLPSSADGKFQGRRPKGFSEHDGEWPNVLGKVDFLSAVLFICILTVAKQCQDTYSPWWWSRENTSRLPRLASQPWNVISTPTTSWQHIQEKKLTQSPLKRTGCHLHFLTCRANDAGLVTAGFFLIFCSHVNTLD